MMVIIFIIVKSNRQLPTYYGSRVTKKVLAASVDGKNFLELYPIIIELM